MKFSKYFLGIFSLILIFSFSVLAQEKAKMTEDEWEAEMGRLKTQKESLTTEISTLNTDINNLKSQNIQSYDDCMNELYTILGVSKSDIDNYRTAVNELNGKIGRKEGPKADRQKDLNALKMNKISALPEFFDKVQNQMQRDLDSWVEEPTVKNYEVVRGDCLWRIAQKPEHYGNGFAWPIIYKANRDEIKNPDLIYPKQNFKIPNLTEDEKAKYEKLKMNYKPAPVQ
jgi:nucleoid-associated protein YgaU